MSQTSPGVTHAPRGGSCNGHCMKQPIAPFTPAMRAAIARLDKARSALAAQQRLASASSTETTASGSGSWEETLETPGTPRREGIEVGQPARKEGHPQRQPFDALTSGRKR